VGDGRLDRAIDQRLLRAFLEMRVDGLVLAGKTGTMGDIDANAVGLASWRLGAGRAQQGDGWTDGEPTRRPLPSALRASGSLSLIIDRIVA
jgi:hypothetical protein